MVCSRMTYREADTLLYYLQNLPNVKDAKVYDRTADAAIVYSGGRDVLIQALQKFHYEDVAVPSHLLDHSARDLNDFYQEKLIRKILLRLLGKCFVPSPVKTVVTSLKTLRCHCHWRFCNSP